MLNVMPTSSCLLTQNLHRAHAKLQTGNPLFAVPLGRNERETHAVEWRKHEFGALGIQTARPEENEPFELIT